MDKTKEIAAKNKYLCFALGTLILLRGIVNEIFSDYSGIILYMLGGIAITFILLGITYIIKNPEIVMYIITITMAGICIGLMFAFHAKVNYIMFFIAIIFSSIYERILPIAIETIISTIFMLIFYFLYQKDLSHPWGFDSTAICIVYILGIGLTLFYQCYMGKKRLNELEKITNDSISARNDSDLLAKNIQRTADILVESNEKIQYTISSASEISNHIGSASEEVANEATLEVGSLEKIRVLINTSASQIHDVQDSSNIMSESSISTKNIIENSLSQASSLSTEMTELSHTTENIVDSINALCDKNDKIISILSTLNDITAQTNLLSLNASIEAARAGEQGAGFAVVAEQIRILADSSKAFTSEISSILNDTSSETELLTVKILNQQRSLESCNTNAKQVKESYTIVNANTQNILNNSKDVYNKTSQLVKSFDNTLNNVNQISSSVETTAAAMQEITASILELHENLSLIQNEYRDISLVADKLAGDY